MKYGFIGCGNMGGAIAKALSISTKDIALSDRSGKGKILAQQLGISPHQLSYVTHSNAGEGLLFYGDTIVPFVDNFPKDTELYRLMTTRPSDKKEDAEE